MLEHHWDFLNEAVVAAVTAAESLWLRGDLGFLCLGSLGGSFSWSCGSEVLCVTVSDNLRHV